MIRKSLHPGYNSVTRSLQRGARLRTGGARDDARSIINHALFDIRKMAGGIESTRAPVASHAAMQEIEGERQCL
jgi:hypothetical protein